MKYELFPGKFLKIAFLNISGLPKSLEMLGERSCLKISLYLLSKCRLVYSKIITRTDFKHNMNSYR